MRVSHVPPLPLNLTALALYLNRRDGGAPTVLPQPASLTSTATGLSTDFDLLEWSLPAVNALRGELAPDAFVIWWQDTDTTDPLYCATVLPASARKWGQIVPGSWTRSYAISAVRWCAWGSEESAKVQISAWRGAT